MNEEIMNELKEDISKHVKRLLDEGVRNVNIEIELIHYIKRVVYPERNH